MSKIATKKATKQLQKIVNLVGENGGIINTKDPRVWWSLSLDLCRIDENHQEIEIGVFSEINYDIIHDPVFTLSVTMDNGKITEVEILICEETTILGTSYVDGDDQIHGFGLVEKDHPGLKRRFSDFMDSITCRGPYLTDFESIEKYNSID